MAAVGSVERIANRNVHMVQASPAEARPYGAYHFDRVQAPRHVITDESNGGRDSLASGQGRCAQDADRPRRCFRRWFIDAQLSCHAVCVS